jgi:trigger factor
LINERTLPINIAKEPDDAEMEWPFPGFSRHLLGLSAKDETQIEYTYPAEAAFSTFNGAKGLFKIKVDSVKSRTLPEMDDAFAQTVGDFSSFDDLRERLKNNLQEQAVDDYNREYDEQLLDKILEVSSVKYPPQMLEHEIDHVVDNLKQQLARQGTDIDLYIKSRGTTLEKIREEALPVAEARLKHSLILIEAAEKLKVVVSPEELQSETQRTLAGYSRVMPEKEFRKLISNKENTSGLVSNVMMDLVIEQTQERLRAIARGDEPVADDVPAQEENVEAIEETPIEIDTTQASSDTSP